MSEQSATFRELMKRVEAGSDSAAQLFLDRYAGSIHRAVRRRLNRILRSKFDSQDFVQAVWASFFRHRDKVTRFDRSEQLVAFLTRVAGNKVIDETRRRMQTQKANVNRERPLEGDLAQGETLAGRDPAPSQVAIAKEQWERMAQGIPSHHREILELCAAGETHQRIADKLGVNEKTVRRVLRKLQSRLEK